MSLMACADIMDEERVNALSYVVSQKCGYVKDLLNEIKQAIVDEFVSLGFIIMGYTAESKTWRASSFAETYYNIVQ